MKIFESLLQSIEFHKTGNPGFYFEWSHHRVSGPGFYLARSEKAAVNGRIDGLTLLDCIINHLNSDTDDISEDDPVIQLSSLFNEYLDQHPFAYICIFTKDDEIAVKLATNAKLSDTSKADINTSYQTVEEAILNTIKYLSSINEERKQNASGTK